MAAIKHDQDKRDLSNFGLNFEIFHQIKDPNLLIASSYVSQWWSDCHLTESIGPTLLLEKAIAHIKSNFEEREVTEGVIKTFEMGATKYSTLQYGKGFKANRLIASFRRHIYWYPIVMKEEYDIESSLRHEFHAISCLLMLIENILNKRLTL